MKVSFEIEPKNHIALLAIDPNELNKEKDYKDLLSLITIISADFYLDPELEIDYLKELCDKAKSDKKSLLISFDEEGIELEFKS